MKVIGMLMSLRGGYGKLKEDLANRYAGGDDGYFRSPAAMRDYLVNWRNYAARPMRAAAGGLAFAQDKFGNVHATIGDDVDQLGAI